jgi:hypothetical protein
MSRLRFVVPYLIFAVFSAAVVAFGGVPDVVGVRVGATLSLGWLFATRLLRLPVWRDVRRRTWIGRHREVVAPDKRPKDLERLERIVSFQQDAGDLHYRLRPVLRDIAIYRLATRGIDLDRDATKARGALGDVLFDIVRADRPAPRDRRAPGIGKVGDIAAMVTRLEEL